jgi:hypothetical protein
MDAVAQLLQVPTARVSGVATFYHYFRLQPRGRYMINICMGTACYVKGADRVAAKFREELGIDFGQTTTDGQFSLARRGLPRHLRSGPGRNDQRARVFEGDAGSRAGIAGRGDAGGRVEAERRS